MLLVVLSVSGGDAQMLRGELALGGSGAYASVSERGVQAVLRDVVPELERQIGHMHIPDFKQHNVKLGNIRTSGFHCPEPCLSVQLGGGGFARM